MGVTVKREIEKRKRVVVWDKECQEVRDRVKYRERESGSFGL